MNTRKGKNALDTSNARVLRFSKLKSVIWMMTGTLFVAGCASSAHGPDINNYVAPSADKLWIAPASVTQKLVSEENKAAINQELIKPGSELRLSDIISIALQNNPDTRSAWYAARSAADEWLSKKGDYYPEITGYGSVTHTVTSDNGSTSIASFDPTVQLTWLLFDMGGRDADVEEKYQALLAADFTHNSEIQDTVFQVIEYYYEYTSAKASKEAYEISLKEAAANLEAAKQKHDSGLATIADVLQMKTALSQSQVNLDSADGDIQTIRGALATAMGLPANTAFDIEALVLNPQVDVVTQTVDDYVKQAQENRPDLAAQRSEVEAAMAKFRSAHSARYPSLSFTDTLAGGITSQSPSKWENQNTAMLKLSVPIYKGNSLKYNELKAKEDAEKQKAILNKLEQTVIYEVWSSYYSLKTAAQQVKSNEDLMESAQESYDVALGRYKEGVGGYLDLLSAQSSLQSARSQRITALNDWYISLAQLAKYTGTLWQQADGTLGENIGLFSSATIKDMKP